jgi:hypothetical protein
MCFYALPLFSCVLFACKSACARTAALVKNYPNTYRDLATNLGVHCMHAGHVTLL